MKSVMTHSFSQVPPPKNPRSQFNRSFGHKTTFDSGYLIPVFVDEALPGDTFSVRMTSFARLNTPIVPYMDNVFLDSFFFAVPYRLVWDNWQRFNGEQIDPGDSTDFLTPQITAPVGGFANGTIYDYMGLPTQVAGFTFNAFHLRAYNLIWNEWFRDENLQDSIDVPRGDGPDDPALYVLKRRGKRFDYFTSCLPFPQKGPAVAMPLGTEAPIKGRSNAGTVDNVMYMQASDTNRGYAQIPSSDSLRLSFVGTAPASNTPVKWQQPGGAPGDGYNYADLSSATAATINVLRQAVTVQQMLERDARGGTRYTEIIRAHFGVISPDARLQRPEYLGGGSSYVNVTPIAQTAPTADGATPQGNLAAFATNSVSGHGFVKTFTEHCLILGFVSVRADLNYQQGLDKMWSRRTRYDYYWPTFANIGEQAVLNKEIYCQGSANPTVDAAVFGYQERYAEYRYKRSQVTGQFRSNFAQSLDFWHLAQNFETLPTLSPTFIEENPPIDRVIATPDEPQFKFDSYFQYTATRPMPVYGVPGLTRF